MVERNLNATQLCNGAHLTHSLVSRLLSGTTQFRAHGSPGSLSFSTNDPPPRTQAGWGRLRISAMLPRGSRC